MITVDEFDRSVGAHPANVHVSPVLCRRKLGGQRTSASMPERSGSFHLQRLVGSVGIIVVPERIKAFLLFRAVLRGRKSRTFFESSVHSLVPSILLRLAWSDPLMDDPKLYPVNTQP